MREVQLTPGHFQEKFLNQTLILSSITFFFGPASYTGDKSAILISLELSPIYAQLSAMLCKGKQINRSA